MENKESNDSDGNMCLKKLGGSFEMNSYTT